MIGINDNLDLGFSEKKNCAIVMENVFMEYKPSKRKKWETGGEGFAIRNMNLYLPSGSILGLVGANGAGKSTTIKLIMGAIRAMSGEITVLGTGVNESSFNDVKQDIGIVMDEAHFHEQLNAISIGRMMKLTYARWDDEVYGGFLRRFNLPPKQAFKEYSRGMRMKLAIAVALSHDAKLLILDEPTGGLDPLVRDEILGVFNEFTRQENHSVLISSHIISDLEKICDYVAFLHEGELIFCEEKDRLMEEYAIVKLKAEEAARLRDEAVVSKTKMPYGYEVLVRAELVSRDIRQRRENTGLEDIILMIAKGESR